MKKKEKLDNRILGRSQSNFDETDLDVRPCTNFRAVPARCATFGLHQGALCSISDDDGCIFPFTTIDALVLGFCLDVAGLLGRGEIRFTLIMITIIR